MALPSKAQQIQAVEKWLDHWLDRNEDPDEEPLTTNQLAKEVVEGFHGLIQKGIKQGQPPLHEGAAFKTPYSSKVYFVSWAEFDQVWITTADSSYGWLGHPDSPFWEFTEQSRSKVKENEEWNVGDRVSRQQRRHRYEVIATGTKCVLLRDEAYLTLQPESNDGMKRFYRREKGEDDW